MLANDLVALEDIPPIVQALVQVCAPCPRHAKLHLLVHGRVVGRATSVYMLLRACMKHNVPNSQAERLRDEGVQLKTLQTALTLMQSPVLAEDEVITYFLSQEE
jgi:hypothetical protein